MNALPSTAANSEDGSNNNDVSGQDSAVAAASNFETQSLRDILYSSEKRKICEEINNNSVPSSRAGVHNQDINTSSRKPTEPKIIVKQKLRSPVPSEDLERDEEKEEQRNETMNPREAHRIVSLFTKTGLQKPKDTGTGWRKWSFIPCFGVAHSKVKSKWDNNKLAAYAK
jgi:hypothetical protein